MSSAPHFDMRDLDNVYADLATALGAAHQQAALADGSPDRFSAVDRAAQQLWSLTVQRVGAGQEQAGRNDIPPVVEPDLQAPADLDVDAILDHVAAFDPAAAVPAAAVPAHQPWSSFGRACSARTAALVWCAVAAVLAVVLGIVGGGPVVVSALVPSIATALLVAWWGFGRAPGALWAVGLMPLVILVASPFTAWAFVVLVEGFAYLAYRSSAADGSWQTHPSARRRPLEIELVLYSLAAWTTGIDLVALLFVACIAGLLWRRRWTAATAAAAGLAFFLFVVELGPSAFLSAGLVYAILAAHWARAIFHGPWLASRLSVTEIGLALSGRALRGGWRMAQQTVENALPPLTSPGRGGLFQDVRGGGDIRGGGGVRAASSGGGNSRGDDLRYCWTCHRSTPHQSAGFSLPICQRCVDKAGGTKGGRTFSQSCPVCGGHNPHTDGGKCMRCWKKGR